MKIICSTLILSAVLFSGCSRPGAEEMFRKAVDEQSNGQYDNAIASYQDLIKTFPDSSRTPEAYYAIGTLFQNEKKNYSRALESYKDLVRLFPRHATASNAAFNIGFIYNNDLHQYDSAKAAYEYFIRTYPGDELVKDAQMELAYLGKTPEEILQAQTQRARAASRPAKKK